ncbi:prospero homeobox protein 2 [Sardina pilchardus]|uniref:prospero homeobox protein 2 n=1 Tax=Sardina pilchardus TaxID=27697 RepID=UPI002E145D97
MTLGLRSHAVNLRSVNGNFDHWDVSSDTKHASAALPSCSASDDTIHFINHRIYFYKHFAAVCLGDDAGVLNMNLPEQSMHSPAEGCLKEDKSEIMVSCCHRNMFGDPLAAYPNNSIISHLLRKTIHNKRAMSGNMFYLPPPPTLSGLDDTNMMVSKDSMEPPDLRERHSPISTSVEVERPLSDHLQAKRARVENIIRGMAGSPNSRLQGEEDVGDPDLELDRKEFNKENKRKQRLPQHQESSAESETPANMAAGRGGSSSSSGGGGSTSKNQECHKLKQQLHSMQRLLQQLEDKFFQVYNQHDSEINRAEDEMDDIGHADQSSGLTQMKAAGEAPNGLSVSEGCESRPDWTAGCPREKAVVDVSCLGSKRDGKNLQETLKYELSRAVNESIDTVFQKLSSTLLTQSSPSSLCHPCTPDSAGSVKRTHMSCSPLVPSSTEEATIKPRPLPYYRSSTPQTPEQQTEALSLVVRKSPHSPLNSTGQSVKQPYPFHQPPFQFGYAAPLHDTQILEHLLKYGPHGNLGGLACLPAPLDRASPDSEDLPWESMSMRSKVMSSHLGQHSRPGVLGSVSVDGLCLPHVKMECRDLQSMAERSSYISLSIQEGLTPNHLKKAKLMFFYTRYPSSSVLKTYFPDVKFNRCITSQLIKWFSNFREFYYIQMEKFARQAIVDGVNDVKGLTVTRDCELFRALNMHYNKANDFQVPERFLEVAEITLQEFFTAVLLAKDSDPSWKKAIYKVICKLDSDVPEDFKTSTYL